MLGEAQKDPNYIKMQQYISQGVLPKEPEKRMKFVRMFFY